LRGEDGVDRRVGERDRLGGAGTRVGLGYDPLEHRPHRVERLDRDHMRVATGEHLRELSGAGPEIENGGSPAERQQLEDAVGVRRTCLVVLGRDAIEAAPGLLHVRSVLKACAATSNAYGPGPSCSTSFARSASRAPGSSAPIELVET